MSIELKRSYQPNFLKAWIIVLILAGWLALFIYALPGESNPLAITIRPVNYHPIGFYNQLGGGSGGSTKWINGFIDDIKIIRDSRDAKAHSPSCRTQSGIILLPDFDMEDDIGLCADNYYEPDESLPSAPPLALRHSVIIPEFKLATIQSKVAPPEHKFIHGHVAVLIYINQYGGLAPFACKFFIGDSLNDYDYYLEMPNKKLHFYIDAEKIMNDKYYMIIDEKPSGYGLAKDLIPLLPKWQFNPARKNGMPIGSFMLIRYYY